MQNENSRNTIIFFVCAALIMGVYYFMVMRPQAEMRRQQQVVAAEQKAATADAGLTSGSAAPAAFVADRAQALGTAARVPIQTPKLKGSLSLQGARIDDLYLTDYKETLDKNSTPVELFRPQGMEHAYFAQFGWSGPNVAGGVPGPNTPWTLTKGATLTSTTPVELTWDNGQGLRFTRVIAIDDQYVFTVTDTVANLSGQPITIAPYGRVERQGVPADLGKQMILHEGAIGTFGANGKFATEQVKYKDWAKKPRIENQSTGGWLGITDKYWMAALIPDQKETIEGRFAVRDPEGLNAH